MYDIGEQVQGQNMSYYVLFNDRQTEQDIVG